MRETTAEDTRKGHMRWSRPSHRDPSQTSGSPPRTGEPGPADHGAEFPRTRFRGLPDGPVQPEQSFATQIPWWPLISVLGTFSAGKSTFINHYLGSKLQRSGNQAVDDKFTVLCFSGHSTTHALPGQALDSDLVSPFTRSAARSRKSLG